jgi:hypothetical protein
MNTTKAALSRPTFLQLPPDMPASFAAHDPSVRHVRPYIDLRGECGPVHSRILSCYARALTSGKPMRIPWQSRFSRTYPAFDTRARRPSAHLQTAR